MDKEEIIDAIDAILDGYPTRIVGNLIVVNNPNYRPGQQDGSNPALVINLEFLRKIVNP